MKDKDKKKKKLSSSGMTTKEKMLARKKALESKGNNNGLIFPKEGSTRIRLKSPSVLSAGYWWYYFSCYF